MRYGSGPDLKNIFDHMVNFGMVNYGVIESVFIGNLEEEVSIFAILRLRTFPCIKSSSMSTHPRYSLMSRRGLFPVRNGGIVAAVLTCRELRPIFNLGDELEFLLGRLSSTERGGSYVGV